MKNHHSVVWYKQQAGVPYILRGGIEPEEEKAEAAGKRHALVKRGSV
jgi:hypothetical protein